MVLRTARDGKAREVSLASGLDTGREGLVQKQYAPLVDVNRIVKQFGVTHELPVVADSKAAYGDFSVVSDFHSAMNAMVAARENFDRLPAKTREYFGNDPGGVWEFLQDPANDAEAVRLGLFKALPVPVIPVIQNPVEVPQVP